MTDADFVMHDWQAGLDTGLYMMAGPGSATSDVIDFTIGLGQLT